MMKQTVLNYKKTKIWRLTKPRARAIINIRNRPKYWHQELPKNIKRIMEI